MREGNYHLFFGMFANRLKVDIVQTLMQKPMPVTELATILKTERSTVSHALLIMNKCHLVEIEKSGKQRIYSLNKETVKPLMQLVDKHVKRHCKYCLTKKESEIK